jgi:hypothetical protein
MFWCQCRERGGNLGEEVQIDIKKVLEMKCCENVQWDFLEHCDKYSKLSTRITTNILNEHFLIIGVQLN